MFTISTHIYEELKSSNIILKELDSFEREKVLKTIEENYIDNEKKGGWIWEKLRDSEEMNADIGWTFIKDYIGNNECIMFFNQNEEKKMFIISSGNDLNYLLSETCGYEFYITNKKCDYIICFNHHNTLFGCGDARKWIESLKN